MSFDFSLIGNEEVPFSGYSSSYDKTKQSITSLIRGSYNMYKKRSGNWANRFGLKRIGDADDTPAGTTSSFEYVTRFGTTLPMQVVGETSEGAGDAILRVKFEGEWVDLMETGTLANPALTKSRFVFDTWYDGDLSNALSEFKDRVVMVRGGIQEILHWSGGITRIGSVQTFLNSINNYSLGVAGTGYAVGDVLTVLGGTGATILVTGVSSTGVIVSSFYTGYYITNRGYGYAVGVFGTTGGSGTGAFINVASVATSYSLTKFDTSTTWKEDGFTNLASNKAATSAGFFVYTKFVINGVEYAYLGGADTDTLTGIVDDISGLVSGALAVQPVYVEDVDELPDGFECDFIRTLENQLCVGSYSARTVHISCSTTVGQELGFTNFLAITNSLVIGDPDFALLDANCNGMVIRKGKLYVSTGTSDWWEVTLNSSPPTAVPFYHGLPLNVNAYIITKIEKQPGTGLSGLLAHEFADVIGDNIVYVGKDHQVHNIGSFTNIQGSQFPILSQDVYEELQDEDFTGGHLRIIEDFVYITAPVNGRHWLYQIRTSVNQQGLITTEKIWHPPQVSGLSRIAEIEGVEYGYSATNPVLYQIWDTGQWWDDSPTSDEEADRLAYNSVMRMAYRNHGFRFTPKTLDAIAFEGYIDYGTPLYGNVYLEYQGAKGTLPIEINTDDNPIIKGRFIGSVASQIGGDLMASSPLGSGPLPESNDQELLPKFKAIRDIPISSCTEYCLEVLSNEIGARWEIVCLGSNTRLSSTNAQFLKD